MKLKVVTSDWTGVHEDARQDVVYRIGEITEAPDWDPEPECGGGLYYAEGLWDYLPETPEGGHLLEIEPVGEVVRVENNQSKTNRLRVIREITAVPTPDEEPDAGMRRLVAGCIPAKRLDHLLTPDEEPDATVRWHVASRIPADRIDRLPTSDEEPDEYVHWCLAERIPVDRLDHLLTPNEEPDADIRLSVAARIPTDRLDHIPTPAEEPDADVRRMVEKRLKEK